MATVGDSLKANIRIGGTIDPSWRNSVEGLKKELSGTKKLLESLTRQQERLKKQIDAAGKENKDVAALTAEYEKLGQEIQAATRQQTLFNKKLKSAERLTRWKG
ncbi:hypothetical protein GQN03_24550, partial [Escherichia coli]|nr:hypothetical protein [Escherichia coli]